MVIFNDKEYSGYVAKIENGEITVVINTNDMPQDVVPTMKDVNEIVEVNNGNETHYNITAPISCKFLNNGIYILVWSIKPTFKQVIEEKLQEQSDAIDDLLIMMLEG